MYLSTIKMEERVEQVEQEMNLWSRAATLGPAGPSTLSKYAGGRAPGPYAGLGAAKGPPLVGCYLLSGPGLLCDLLAAELMIGFWFGIGVILAVKMVQSLECCIEELISRK